MKKETILTIIIEGLIAFLYYYFVLPPINLSSIEFWKYIILLLIILTILLFGANKLRIQRNISVRKIINEFKLKAIPLGIVVVILLIISITNLICSPVFNAKSYSERIKINENGDFNKDIKEVDFNMLPLLDRDSSEKLGDRTMGQMKDLVSQFYVSEQYTQINYNNEIIRVTPLEYADPIKWLSNRKKGVTGYITVNSVTGKSKLEKLSTGMKYMPSAHFNEKLIRKLRFTYPTLIFSESKFEIDNDGKPYWITPYYTYTGFGLKTKVSGVIILDPISGNSKKYNIKNVPNWVDNAYNSDLIIEQLDDWGTYNNGFINSIFGQKNVTNTTDGYNYLAMNDDIYLYTGITSVLSDESNLGFVLSNMRTGETTFYNVPGAEEYSAMSSAEGQVQQMKYKSTFPLLINLNGKPTYLVSLKDSAGLVKMYGFIDVEDYQKVSVTDASKGILNSANNYLELYGENVKNNIKETKEITIKNIKDVVIKGTTYYYLIDEEDNKYKISIEVSDELPFINVGTKKQITYINSNNKIKEIETIK